MKTLIEDYKRRLITTTEMIDEISRKKNLNHIDLERLERLQVKQNEYRTFIAELNREYRNYITSKLDALMDDYEADTNGGGSAGTLRALLN